MDPTHSSEMLKHLQKQDEVLMNAYRTLLHELHNLQVEEETLMHKLYELMTSQGLLKKKKKGESQRENDTTESVQKP